MKIITGVTEYADSIHLFLGDIYEVEDFLRLRGADHGAHLRVVTEWIAQLNAARFLNQSLDEVIFDSLVHIHPGAIRANLVRTQPIKPGVNTTVTFWCEHKQLNLA